MNGNYKEYTWVNNYGGWLGKQNGVGFFNKFIVDRVVVYIIYVSYSFAYIGCYDSATDVLRGQKFDY